MSRRAWAYISAVLLLGAALVCLSFAVFSPNLQDFETFLVLTVLATVSQHFEAEHGKQSFYPHLVFFFAGLILLSPFFFVLLVAIPHLVEWGKDRLAKSPHLRAWYIQPFNVSAHIAAGLGAQWIYQSFVHDPTPTFDPLPVLAATIAVIVYILANHALVGGALVLCRGVSWKDSGILEMESLVPDFILAYLGYIVAMLWIINPWLTIPALSPLVLMYRALMVPQLKQEAQTDGKTGLWNARHFTTLFNAEVERAKRFDRPLTVIMADLDLLRNVNNTYGHLAGDAVLTGIGRIIRDNVREYDIAARFGGEEFAVCLPETGPMEARALAERVRAAVEAASFEVSTAPTPIDVTMSFGVACFPWDADTPTTLIHEADVAVYQAKLKGRNCVVAASEVPHFIKLENAAPGDRLAAAYTASFTPRPFPLPASVQAAGATATHSPARQTAPLIPIAERFAGAATGQVSDDETTAPATAQAGEQSQAATVAPGAGDAPQSSPADTRPAPKGKTSTGPIGGVPQYHYPRGGLGLFVALTIVAGIALTLVGFVAGSAANLGVLALLVAFAATAELLQINVFGDNTVSVSVAIVFAAAIITGLPGVACVSAVIVLAHYIQVRPALYKTMFNWATHVLAGLAPVVMFTTLAQGLALSNLLFLVVPTIVAAVAYYAIETGLVSAAISLAGGYSPLATWEEQFKWLFTHYLVLCTMGVLLAVAYNALGPMGAIIFMVPILMMRYAQKQYVDRTEDSVQELKRMNLELTHANREVVGASRAMQELNEELFLTLSRIIDARDPYVSGHAAKVSDYATAIGMEMGLQPERLEKLRQAGFLHDIGKIGISEEVLHKPARLTTDEYRYVKTHASMGGEFLEMCRGLRHLAPFVKHHHEWWDGSGYPDGLKGSEIPLEARILAVCDAAEAMASDRPYRRGMSLPEIIEEIRACAGTQFDPVVAEAFARIAEREKDKFLINSAREVLRKQIETGMRTGPPSASELPSENLAAFTTTS